MPVFAHPVKVYPSPEYCAALPCTSNTMFRVNMSSGTRVGAKCVWFNMLWKSGNLFKCLCTNAEISVPQKKWMALGQNVKAKTSKWSSKALFSHYLNLHVKDCSFSVSDYNLTRAKTGSLTGHCHMWWSGGVTQFTKKRLGSFLKATSLSCNLQFMCFLLEQELKMLYTPFPLKIPHQRSPIAFSHIFYLD